MLAKKMVLFTFVLMVGIFSCADDSTSATDNELMNRVWKLESFETIGSQKTDVPEGEVHSIIFYPSNSANMVADCNGCHTVYELLSSGNGGRRIKIDRPMCTNAFCGEESMDMRFRDGVANAEKYRIEGQKLMIYYNGGKEVLNFKAQN